MRKNWIVTREQMKEMRGNTEFWTSLFKKMTSEAFVHQAKHYLSNCSHRRFSNVTYDDAVMCTVLPEALRRIEALELEVSQLKRELGSMDQGGSICPA